MMRVVNASVRRHSLPKVPAPSTLDTYAEGAVIILKLLNNYIYWSVPTDGVPPQRASDFRTEGTYGMEKGTKV